MAIKSDDEFINGLVKVLGLPKGTKAFCLKAAVDQRVEVDCTYYPNPEDFETVLTERFTLERIENQEPSK